MPLSGRTTLSYYHPSLEVLYHLQPTTFYCLAGLVQTIFIGVNNIPVNFSSPHRQFCRLSKKSICIWEFISTTKILEVNSSSSIPPALRHLLVSVCVCNTLFMFSSSLINNLPSLQTCPSRDSNYNKLLIAIC